MKSALKISVLCHLALFLSFCTVFQKDKQADKKEIPKYENYSSSGIYQDIENEAGDVAKSTVQDIAQAQGRKVSSEEYQDDDYGNVSGGEEEVYMGGDLDVENDEEPAPMNDHASDPIPVGDEAEVASSYPAFKNGMYRTNKECEMKSEPSSASNNEGAVPANKKLWMEKVSGDNAWVKVYKKSGAAYLPRSCVNL